MDDSQIVELYWSRAEEAVPQTAAKYGKYLYGISWNILYQHEDAEECVNDTYQRAWNAMPPSRPSILSAFLGKITRRLSIDRWRRAHTQMRGSGQIPLALSELEECVSATSASRTKWSGRSLQSCWMACSRPCPRQNAGCSSAGIGICTLSGKLGIALGFPKARSSPCCTARG